MPLRGTTVRLRANAVRDIENNPITTPEIIDLTVTNPNDVSSGITTGIFELSGGNYYYDYEIPPTAPIGSWVFEWRIQELGKTGRARTRFNVD